MDKQLQKTALVAAGAATLIILAFVLGMKVVGNWGAAEIAADNNAGAASSTVAAIPAPEASPKAGVQSQDAIVDHLVATEELLQQVLADMVRASAANKGGYVEKSREDLRKGVEDISAAVAYAKGHPEIAQLPIPPAMLDIAAQIEVAHRGRAGVAPNLQRALDELGPALDQLHKTAGGDIGGFRDKALADIKLAADDIAAGYAIAAGGRGPAVAPPPPGPVTPQAVNLVPTPTPDKYKPLRFAPAPANGTDLVLAAAQRSLPLRFADFNDPKLREILPPFRYFLLNPSPLGDTLAVEALQDNGFQYFIRLNGAIIGQSDVRAGPNGDFRSISIGTGSNRLPEIDAALGGLADDDRVKKGSYEARLLVTNPPTPLYAFWLVSDNGAPDLVYPMVAPTGVTARTLYVAADFVKAFKASPQVQVRAVRAIQAPAPVVGPGSATVRLQALQAALKASADNLQRAETTKKAAFLDKTLADIATADATITAALDYLKAHPEADALPMAASGTLTQFDPPNGYGIPSRADVAAVYPTIGAASGGLIGGLREFMNGPGGAGPVIGDIGGFRDMVMQDAGIACTSLVEGTIVEFGGRINGGYRGARQPLPAGGKLGSVTGVVVGPNGPVAHAAVMFEIPNSNSTVPARTSATTIYLGGILATITNDKGEFTILDLPAGSYMINVDVAGVAGPGSRSNGSKAVEVKEGAQTALDAPIQLRSMGRGGSGG